MSDISQPGWRPDPTGRHDLRWWDGERWTDRVAAHAAETFDPYDDPDATMAGAPDSTQMLAPVQPPVIEPDPTVAMPVTVAPAAPVYEREVVQTTPAGPVGPPGRSGNTWWIVALVVLGLIIVGLAVALIVSSNNSSNSPAPTTTVPTTVPTTSTTVAPTTTTVRRTTTTEAPTTTTTEPATTTTSAPTTTTTAPPRTTTSVSLP